MEDIPRNRGEHGIETGHTRSPPTTVARDLVATAGRAATGFTVLVNQGATVRLDARETSDRNISKTVSYFPRVSIFESGPIAVISKVFRREF